jgi:hypothetical protein
VGNTHSPYLIDEKTKGWRSYKIAQLPKTGVWQKLASKSD